ncbi:hypothetical protein N7452_004468 [Penicillium brevicompactum]|uniref:Uncharacterized protein n=1 Tax=Penicillium brevicompactum TaxID=5074 RepID=A0A9W9QH01_PENBR|nr:hypothetical protein N7452_004468 [Penicillium brevicompactum]
MKHFLQLIAGVGVAAAVPLQHRAGTTYFFTFGDSYTQTNFDINGTQPSAGNPMGNPTIGTGTTAGGINWVGDLTTVENSSLVLSYNLAVGGASIDNSIVNTSVKDVTTQVSDFERTYSNKPESAPWTSENAVFGVWIGINDIGSAYSSNEASVLVPKLLAQYKSLIENIYANGGRKFLILNVPPTSRSPLLLDQGTDAVEAHAKWLAYYNESLQKMVDDFKANNSGTTTVLYDSWTFMTKVLDSPETYGFPDATCINDDGTSCVWYNDYHPGQKYHKLQAADMKPHLQALGAW